MSATDRVVSAVSRHPRIVLTALLVALALAAGVGEAAAHNPAGVAVPGCENGAAAVAEHNPNCHSG